MARLASRSDRDEPASVRRALAAMRDLDSLDPGAIRQRVVHALADVAEGDGAVFWSLADTADGLVVTRTHDTGVAGAGRYFDGLRAMRWPNAMIDPWRPRRASANRLECGVASGFVETMSRTPYWDLLWKPLGIRDQLRGYLYHGDRFVGTIAAGRFLGGSTFVARDAARSNGVIPSLVAALLTAESAEHGGDCADLVVTADGRIELASASARAWLTKPGVPERIAAVVRALERGDTLALENVALAGLEWSRLHSDTRHVYLLHLTPLAPVAVKPDAPLTPTQRRAAEFLAAGATVREAARAMGIAPETVRTHVREVYRRLNVGSRAELANALSRGGR